MEMNRQNVTIIQTSSTVRQIIVEVEAIDHESAVEALQNGDIDLPAFDDPGWTTNWTLQSEEYE